MTAPPPRRRVEATVRGRVQGVGFRMFVLDRAESLGLRGWVANERDGSVRLVAEGSEAALRALLEACREGPRGAAVGAVDAAWGDASGSLGEFAIRSGWHRGD